jgi:hypothetical protein
MHTHQAEVTRDDAPDTRDARSCVESVEPQLRTTTCELLWWGMGARLLKTWRGAVIQTHLAQSLCDRRSSGRCVGSACSLPLK